MAVKKRGVWDISFEINGQTVKNNLNDIGKSIGQLNRDLKKLQPGTDEFVKKSEELKKARARYKEIKDEINGTNVSLQEAKSHFNNVFEGFVSGDIKMVQSGLKGISGNLKGMTKAALAFIATPIGLAITALAGIGLAAKSWFDFNVQVFETNKLVKELTNETGKAVDAIRIRAEVLRDTFEIDLNESIKSAKTLVNGFGISYDEAFNLIEDSAVRGKHKNQEFFDSLKEYPIQFKNAGFSAQEFINIVNTGADLSIYSDKLPDAIKEFTLSITEQTPAAKEALNNAFGEQFTNQLFTNLKSGAITSKDALQLISKEAENIGLNSQQAQLLTADLFKGAGEDAGGALKIFEAINISLNGQQKPLTENQELTAKQLEINKELSGVYTQLFASGNSAFQNLIAKGKIFATETLLKILKGGVDVYNWFVDLNNESGTFSAILSAIGKIGTTQFRILQSFVKILAGNIKGLGTILEGAFTFKWDKVKQGFLDATKNINKVVTDFKTNNLKDFLDVKKAFEGGVKMKKINILDYTENTSTNPIENPIEKPSKETVESGLTAEDKKIIESKKKLKEWLKKFNEEQAIENEIKDLAKNEADKLKEELELEAKYVKLRQQANGDTELLKELKEAQNAELAAIQKKWDDKSWEEYKKKKEREEKEAKRVARAKLNAERELFNAKRQLLSASLNAIKSFTKQGSIEYKTLFAIEKIVAAAQVILDGIKERAKIAAVWGWNPAVSGPMIAASKIRQFSALTTIASTALKGFFKGGFTGNNAIRYDDQDGVAFDTPNGPFHIGEWVAPKIMVQNPKYAANIAYLESERKRMLQGYYNGGPVINDDSEMSTNSSDSMSSTIMYLKKSVDFLNSILVNGITAKTYIGYPEIKDLVEAEKEIDDSENYGKIAN